MKLVFLILSLLCLLYLFTGRRRIYSSRPKVPPPAQCSVCQVWRTRWREKNGRFWHVSEGKTFCPTCFDAKTVDRTASMIDCLLHDSIARQVSVDSKEV